MCPLKRVNSSCVALALRYEERKNPLTGRSVNVIESVLLTNFGD